MSTFTLLVTYAAGHTDLIKHLTPRQLEDGLGAFSRDMMNLEGQGVTRLEAYIETVIPIPRTDVFGNPLVIEA